MSAAASRVCLRSMGRRGIVSSSPSSLSIAKMGRDAASTTNNCMRALSINNGDDNVTFFDYYNGTEKAGLTMSARECFRTTNRNPTNKFYITRACVDSFLVGTITEATSLLQTTNDETHVSATRKENDDDYYEYNPVFSHEALLTLHPERQEEEHVESDQAASVFAEQRPQQTWQPQGQRHHKNNNHPCAAGGGGGASMVGLLNHHHHHRFNRNIRSPFTLATNHHHHHLRHFSATHQQQVSQYHTSTRRELVLYGSIIIVVALGYVGYKTYRGEPIKPISATKAQEDYRRMEQEREQRNQAWTQKQNKHEYISNANSQEEDKTKGGH